MKCLKIFVNYGRISARLLSGGGSLHSRVTFDFIIDAMTFAQGRAILDAGAGHQRFKPFFSNSIYLSQEHPSGIEFKNMQGLNYDFVHPMDDRIPLKSDSLACIYNHSVLEHVRHPQLFLNEAFRVLSPGGRIYIHVPFMYCEHEVPYDFQRPTRYGLDAWLKAVGFNRIWVMPSSSQSYGSSAHALMAASQDCNSRGKGSEFQALLPILRYCIHYMNAIGNDYVDVAATTPIGWVAIAGKDGELPEYCPQTKDQFLQLYRD
jgi:SAM-dependent methyltransferase